MFYGNIVRRVLEIPGVESAAVTDALPLDRNRTWGISAKGQAQQPGRNQSMFVRVISPGYFSTMKIPIKQGEDFPAPRAPPSKERLVIINETAARTLWPGPERNRTPRRHPGQRSPRHRRGRRREASRRWRKPRGSKPICRSRVRTGGLGRSGDAHVDAAHRLAASCAARSVRWIPKLPTADVRIMQDLVDKAVSPRRFITWLLTAFAVQPLRARLSRHLRRGLLFGDRTHARDWHPHGAGRIARRRAARVLRETLALAAVGAVLGLIGAFAAARIITSPLFGLSSTDPATLAGMIAVLFSGRVDRRLHPGPPRVTHRRDDRRSARTDAAARRRARAA